MNLTDNLYREEILEHYQSPHNFGKLEDVDSYGRQTNPLCGDDIEMYVKFDHNGKSAGVNGKHLRGVIGSFTIFAIKDIKFLGKGCAICIAAASMLTDFSRGKTKEELTKFTEKDMLSLLGIEISETRKKCAMLALAVLKDCINGTQSKN